jgi:alpha-L-fucosidase
MGLRAVAVGIPEVKICHPPVNPGYCHIDPSRCTLCGAENSHMIYQKWLAAVAAAAALAFGTQMIPSTKADEVTPATTQPLLSEEQYAAQFPAISIAPGPFTADESSFKQYQYPQWLRDAKLGIWAHWGPQAVPMEGDWYARKMYEQGDKDYKDHLARFGHPSKTGYKDIIPLWKAEKWDPDALMALYKKAGARYFVAQAVHHDNFDNWNSKYHKWNSVNMGPHRDVVGDWQKAAEKQGLPFGVSEHLGASFSWFQDSHGSDKTGPLAGIPYDGANPAFFDLYHYPKHADDKSNWYTNNPLWQKEWYARIKDLVDNYHPDLLYSDGGVVFGNDVGRGMIAHLYNTSAARNGGVVRAVYNCKQNSNGMWVEDLERGVMAGIRPYPWQTDTSIGDWFYNKHWKYRSAEWVVHSLVDIVSKNGNLLINVVQRPDGSLDDEATKIVKDLGDWMAVNGEGIYETRPWITFGEGKSHAKGGSFKEDYVYTADDIRFTAKGDTTLYAFILGYPEDHKTLIHSLAKTEGVTGKIDRVSLLGYTGDLKWKQDETGLSVELPDNKPSDFAVTLKIEGQNLTGFKPATTDAQSIIKPDAFGTYTLTPGEAELQGVLHVQNEKTTPNLSSWHNASDGASWTLNITQPGKYDLTASYACDGNSLLQISTGTQKVQTQLTSTGNANHYIEVPLGTVSFDKTGNQTLSAGGVDAKTWTGINLRWIKLVKAQN